MTLKPNDFWYTPTEVWDSIRYFFECMPFDPCPVDPSFDGLEGDWPLDCYINSPYSKTLKRAFVNKGIEQFRSGKRFLWMFNYANSQDLANIHKRASAVLIPEKRFEFIPGHPLLTGHPDNPDPEKRKPGSPQYDNVMVLWGDPDGFTEAFERLGFIYIKPSKGSDTV